jgi:hypothetical protein
MKINSLLALAVFSLCGCSTQNPFTVYYRDVRAQQTPQMQAIVRAPPRKPQVIQIDSFQNKPDFYKTYWDRGYMQLGYSDFGGAQQVTQNMILAHARRVGAELVLYFSSYTHSEPGVRAVNTYRPGANVTTTTQGNVSVSGTGGLAYGNYGQTSVTASQGTINTHLVPATHRHYEHFAMFLGYKKPQYLSKEQRALGL